MFDERPVCDDLRDMIELLETRIAPAGIVSVFLKAGVLTLGVPANDEGAQSITISNPSAGVFVITPDSGTQLQLGSAIPLAAGAALTVDGVFSDIKAALGDGADALFLDTVNAPRNVTFDGGEGDDSLRVKSSAIGGTLTVLGGGGADTISLEGDRLSVASKLSLSGGAGDNIYNIAATSLTVGRDFEIRGGINKDTINAAGATNSSISVGGAFSVLGSAGQFTMSVSPASAFTVAGAMSVIADGRNTPVAVTLGSSGNVFIGGNATFQLGNANNTATFASGGEFRVMGNISYTGGIGTDTVGISANSISVGGGVTAKVFSGANAVTISASTLMNIERDLKLSADNGNDTFELTGSGRIGGKLTVALGGGAGQSALISGGSSALFIGKGVALAATGIGAATTATLKGLGIFGATSVFLGDGADTLNIDNVQFFGATTIDTAAGVDAVKIEKAGTAGTTKAYASFKIQLGAGADTLAIGTDGVANDFATFAVKWFADGGAGANVRTLSTTNIFEPFGHVFKAL